MARRRWTQAPDQQIYVVPNSLSKYWLSANRHIGVAALTNQRIGFASGSCGMSFNYAVAAEAIANFLNNSTTGELSIIGPLSFGEDQISVEQVIRGP